MFFVEAGKYAENSGGYFGCTKEKCTILVENS
jgi:hypothetical protein